MNQFTDLSAESDVDRLAVQSYPELSPMDREILEASIDVMTQNPVGTDRINLTFDLKDIQNVLSAFDVALTECPGLERDLSLLIAQFITAKACLS